MNDRLETTASSLAVVEKKPQRPGGCVGIFFQLFDWNRRLAKKKLFSKKLLPPVRLKQASKKFGGDEKQPKLRLIADENSGGFPSSKNKNGVNNVNCDKKYETRVPGLVARLMGLESMPSSQQREKSKKITATSFASGKHEKAVEKFCEEELNVEKGGIKHESRPQKLQKTNICERQPITRFRPVEKLPFKNVLSKSRKHSHPNHHPKLPSPVKSPRNISRKNSSKLIGAATRILEPGLQTSRLKCALTYSNTFRHPPQNTVMEDKRLEISDGFESYASKGHSNCSNCGYLGQSAIYQELQELHDYHGDFHPHVKFTSYKSPFSGQIQRNLDSQQANNPSKAFQRVPPRPKMNGPTSSKVSSTNLMNGTKNFVSANQTLSGKNVKFEPEKRISTRMNEVGPQSRKRRPNNLSRHSESCSTFGTPHAKVMSEKQSGNKNRFLDPQERTAGSGKTNMNAVPFTFNSSLKHRAENDVYCDGRKKVVKPLPLSGDALGAILEQKLKELTSQGEDLGGNVPKKTTATILHELISALTSEIPFQEEDDLQAISNSTSSTSSQANGMAVKISVGQPPDLEHHSPGSVLDPYFSTESCVSSSVDDSLGCKVLTESSELLDSAASVNTAKSSNEVVIEVLNNVSEILSCNNLSNFKGNKLDHAMEVLLNAELACHNTGNGFSIKHLLIDELETLASVLWMNFGSSLGIEDGKDVNQLKTFVLDSIVEYLDLRFERCCNFSSEVLGKLPVQMMNVNVLIFEIVKVVKSWEELCRLSVDELIEREMSLSLGEWTKCESEVFESGMEISRYLLEIVVDEIVIDLLQPF